MDRGLKAQFDGLYRQNKYQFIIDEIEKIPSNAFDAELVSRFVWALFCSGQYKKADEISLKYIYLCNSDSLWNYRLEWARAGQLVEDEIGKISESLFNAHLINTFIWALNASELYERAREIALKYEDLFSQDTLLCRWSLAALNGFKRERHMETWAADGNGPKWHWLHAHVLIAMGREDESVALAFRRAYDAGCRLR